MKVECKYCRSRIEIDESAYNPGDTVVVECRRCGGENEIKIPETQKREESVVIKVKSTSDQNSVVENAKEENTWKTSHETDNDNDKDTFKEETKYPIPTITLKEGKTTKVRRQSQKKKAETKKTVIDEEVLVITPPPLKPDYKRSKVKNTGEKKERKPIERQPAVYVQKKNHSQGIPTWVLLFIGVIIVGGVILMIRSCGSDNSSKSSAMDNNIEDVTVADSAVSIGEVEPIYLRDTVYITDPEMEEGDDDNQEMHDLAEQEFSQVYIPDATYNTSSDAYKIYPAYIPDEKIGEEWNSSAVIKRARSNGEIDYIVIGEGTIDGYPFSIKGVQLKNGRILGRYSNDYNGIKLDMNGAFDSNGNLIIRLGHKSETSYFVFDNLGYDNNGDCEYEGTWGKENRSATLTLRR